MLVVRHIKLLKRVWAICLAVLFHFLSLRMQAYGQDVLIYNRLCLKKISNATLCADHHFAKSHPGIAVEAANMGIYTNIIQLVPALVSTIVLSSYCDLIAHKVPLLIGIAGQFCCSAWYTICAYFVDWSLYTILLGNFFSGLGGSYALIVMATYSYVSLRIDDENRPLYVAICEGMLGVGMLLGSVMSGPIVDPHKLGAPYWSLFLIATVMPVFAGLLVIFAMEDLKKPDHESITLRDIFSFRTIFHAATSLYRKRIGYQRSIIHTSFVVFFCTYIGSIGSIGLSYLYLVKYIGMSQTEYSLYHGLHTAMKTTFAVAIMPLLMKFNVYSLTSVIWAGAFNAVGFVIMAVATSKPALWIALVLQSGSGVTLALLRNLQASTFRGQDLGKVFAYEGFLQIIMTYLGVIFFKAFYAWTLEKGMAQASFALIAFISVIAMAAVILLNYLLYKHSKYDAAMISAETEAIDDDALLIAS